MARKNITSNMSRSSLDGHNSNYKELYEGVDKNSSEVFKLEKKVVATQDSVKISEQHAENARLQVGEAKKQVDRTEGLVESASESASNAEKTAKDVKDNVNNIVSHSDSNPEVVQSRKPFGMDAFPTLNERLNAQFGDVEEFRPEKLSVIAKMKLEMSERGFNVKWFGAKGDGITDDTEAIQKAVDFVAKSKKQTKKLRFPHGNYIVTRPIILYALTADNENLGQWWYGDAVTIVGSGKAETKIIKTVNSATQDLPSKINNIDSVFVLAGLDKDGNIIDAQRTGISVFDMSVYNKSTYINSYAFYGTASQRAIFNNLNLDTEGKGIYFYDCFSSRFTNLVIACKEKALELIGGTSNYVNMVYSFGVKNPYIIKSVYSNVGTLYADSATGTVFEFGGQMLNVLNLGTESPDASRIISITGYVTVDTLFFHRPFENTSPISLNGVLDIRLITVSEKKVVPENTKIALITYPNKNSVSEYRLGNLQYSSSLEKKNPPYYLTTSTEDKPNGNSNSNLNMSGTSVSFRRGIMQPFLGIRKSENIILGDKIKNKAIYLDNETIFSTSQENVEWQQAYENDDILMMNNTKDNNIFAAVVTEKTNEYVNGNKFKYVQTVSNDKGRPKTNIIGFQHFDRDLNKPIWWSGSGWYDANGILV